MIHDILQPSELQGQLEAPMTGPNLLDELVKHTVRQERALGKLLTRLKEAERVAQEQQRTISHQRTQLEKHCHAATGKAIF